MYRLLLSSSRCLAGIFQKSCPSVDGRIRVHRGSVRTSDQSIISHVEVSGPDCALPSRPCSLTAISHRQDRIRHSLAAQGRYAQQCATSPSSFAGDHAEQTADKARLVSTSARSLMRPCQDSCKNVRGGHLLLVHGVGTRYCDLGRRHPCS